MKKWNFIIAALLLPTMFLAGCEKYLDINENPNGVASPSEPSILASVTNTTALNVYRASDFTGNYVQYLASASPGSDYDTYGEVDGSYVWDPLYNTMSDLHVLHRQAAAKGLNAYAGIADILMALNLNITTNIWGNIPYSEAFTGDSLNPKFDDPKAIYDTCLFLLNRGITSLEQADSGDIDAKSDFIHAGSYKAWIKTGYALKARMLNQVSKTDQYDPQKVLDALSHAYTSNDDDAQVTAFDGGNPWYNVAYSNANLVLGGWLAAYFVDALNGKIYGVFDPRLPLITNKTKMTDKYVGTPNGLGYQGPNNTDGYECYIDMNKWYSSPASPVQIITYAECKFIEAEAAYHANNKPRAYQAYLDGIKANMQKMGVAQNDIDAYINDPAVSVGAGNITLQLIMKEKYVACFLNPVTWDDMRRMNYDYKDFNLPAHAQLQTFIRRVNYPDDEVSRNGNNVPTGIELTDHLWWDK